MGSERAATMMSMLPPTGCGDVATRRDLELLEARIDAKLDQLEARFEVRLEQLHSDLLRMLGTWLFASQAAVIVAVSLLFALR